MKDIQTHDRGTGSPNDVLEKYSALRVLLLHGRGLTDDEKRERTLPFFILLIYFLLSLKPRPERRENLKELYPMYDIILDFSHIRTSWEMHEYFRETFRFPDYYGHNMDALWDCLSCRFTQPVNIVLKNLDSFPQNMKREAVILRKLLSELCREEKNISVQEEFSDQKCQNL